MSLSSGKRKVRLGKQRESAEAIRLRQFEQRRAHNSLFLPKPPAVSFNHKSELHEFAAGELGTDRELTYLEFGVAGGQSIRGFAKKFSNDKSRFVGFDSFHGLPVAWDIGGRSIERGTFSTGGLPPVVDDARVSFVKGWFQNTVPDFLSRPPVDINRTVLVHFDADLYGSTLFLLTCLWFRLPEYYFIMDDFFEDDLVALYDFGLAYPIKLEWIAQHVNSAGLPAQVLGRLERTELSFGGCDRSPARSDPGKGAEALLGAQPESRSRAVMTEIERESDAATPGALGIRPIPSFKSVLKKCVDPSAKLLSIEYEDLADILRAFLNLVPFDSDLYVERYEGVRDGITKGAIPSARNHWVRHGYFEGRLVYGWEEIEFDIRELVGAPQVYFDNLLRGSLAESREDYETSEAAYRSAIGAFGQGKGARLALATLYFRMLRLIDCEKVVAELIAFDPSMAGACNLISEVASQFDQNERSLRFSSESQSDRPNIYFVMRLLKTGRVGLARKLISRARGDKFVLESVAAEIETAWVNLRREFERLGMLRADQSLTLDDVARLALVATQLGEEEAASWAFDEIFGNLTLRSALRNEELTILSSGLRVDNYLALMQALNLSRGPEAAAREMSRYEECYEKESVRDRIEVVKLRIRLAYEMDDAEAVKGFVKRWPECIKDYSVFFMYANSLIRSGGAKAAVALCASNWSFVTKHPSIASLALTAQHLAGDWGG